ncbi:M48 family metalloprotease [Marinibaculum pumilum]|uniref:M48 family metalloprotease n=1 Tax=Marinibaculum pumilum TaxID=1766165 RepID=A0ABV7KXJ5_9PROT
MSGAGAVESVNGTTGGTGPGDGRPSGPRGAAARGRRRPLAVAVLALSLLGGTALPAALAPPAQALGEEDDGWLPNLISPEQEAQIGAQQHDQIVAQYGGVYDDRGLGAYVAEIGSRLAAASGTGADSYTFTVLDSPIINAFALPGGYVYVTRGLMALANNEAELAGVIAHEMGHVIARHGTERMSRGMIAELGTAILGSVFDSPIAGGLAQTGAGLWLSGYSRDQEREADSLGLDYMRRAGYPPIAVGAFLGTMGQMEDLQKKLGKGGGGFALMATHPQNAERVEAAVAQAGGNTDAAWQGRLGFGRTAYLNRIDGMIYGDGPKQGYVRGNRFEHPELRIAFDVPDGYGLTNTPEAVLIKGPGNAQGVFDSDPRSNPTPAGGDPLIYIRDVWAPQQQVKGLERVEVNGQPGATGLVDLRSRSGAQTVRLVAIRANGAFYRFQFSAPYNQAGAVDPAFERIARSFRILSAAEARRIEPLRLRVVPVQAGDTSASLAAQSALDAPKTDRFRVLNGLRAGEEIAPGERVKTVL